MGMDGFVWFVGVVEDRADPEEIGRVRVRCLGFHTEDLIKLPTADLPWAHVMHPVTDPAMQGVGNSPSFLLEGSWVIGFFRDAESKQQPIIIGSLPGVPQKAADATKGFNDPRGPKSIQEDYKGKDKIPTGSYMSSAVLQQKAKWPSHYYGPYPLKGDEKTLRPALKEPDVSMLARGQKAEEHDSVKRRRLLRTIDVPIARKPTMGATEPLPVEEAQKLWTEPLPRGVEAQGKKIGTREEEVGEDEYITKDVYAYQSGMYPYNHVFESEAGHIIEIDDTPGGERLYRQHMTGTMEEIHPDGKKVVAVIGDNYEIIAGKSNVVIKGDCNVTIEGTKREYIRGDYVLHVDGDYTENIGKNMKSKIGAGSVGNKYEEIAGSYAFNYKENKKGTVHKDVDTMIGGSEFKLVKGPDGYNLIVVEKLSIASTKSKIMVSALTDKVDIYAGGNLVLQSKANTSINAVTAIKLKSDGYLSMHSVTISDIKCASAWIFESTTSDINIIADIGNISAQTPAGVINLN